MKTTRRSIPIVVAAAFLLANLPLLSARVSGQSNPNRKNTAGSPAGSGVPRTTFGTPNSEGIWDFATITPFERPAQFAGKEFLTEAEAKQLEEQWTIPEPTYTKTNMLRGARTAETR